jgi:hypothetical protein
LVPVIETVVFAFVPPPPTVTVFEPAGKNAEVL